MKKFTLSTKHVKILADTLTPVSAYLRLRDVFPHSLLLESSDYHANNNDFSYICCNPIAFISLKNSELSTHYPDGSNNKIKVDKWTDIPEKIRQNKAIRELKNFLLNSSAMEFLVISHMRL